METQAYMAHREIQEEGSRESVEEITETEKEFLKDLYSFMKKRDSPIERIPNLGFKQIDLFVMFKTVGDLGGYHQVTSQQLWKQVYNTLGGNPRSTSAATCTRRHYEKLLLPYECHVKGITMSILPAHQPKHFIYVHHARDDGADDGGQRPAKRKLISLPPHQNPHASQSDQHRSAFLLPHHYPRYHHPSHVVLPPRLPMPPVLTPHSPPTPQPQFSFDPYQLNVTERVKEPLEHLRYLAERYKTSSGLTEPLNLSVKAPRPDATSSPASSFTAPSTSKTPKFLNKPSPLYTGHCSQVVRSDKGETQDGGLAEPACPAKEAYVIDVDGVTPVSPAYDSAPTEAAAAQNPRSPNADYPRRPSGERGGSPGRASPGLLRENDKAEVEIEIPLSVFNSWLKLCRSSATAHRDKQPLEHSRLRDYAHGETLPTNLTFHVTQPQIGEDLSPRPRNTPNNQTDGSHSLSQQPFTGYRPLGGGGILRSAASRDVYPFDQSHGSVAQSCWNANGRPVQFGPDVTAVRGGKEKSEVGPAAAAALVMNSGSAPVFHLTSEEVMKLKKIISSAM